ncbi:MAG: NYN domain-containing protein [Acidobacteriota bacterium]
MMDCRPKIAVYFDADNIGLTYAPSILRFLAPSWDTYLKRAYGRNLRPHETILREQGIVPVEVVQNGNKNAADIALIVDAMEELCRGNGQAFCIVSDDSDFTRLVQRIRECGKTVLVCGTQSTSLALRNSCTEFLVLQKQETPPKADRSPAQAALPASVATNQAFQPPLPFEDPETKARLQAELRSAFLEIADGKEELDLCVFGAHIRRSHPGLSHKEYGVRQFSRFLGRIGGFRIRLGAPDGASYCGLDPPVTPPPDQPPHAREASIEAGGAHADPEAAATPAATESTS